MAINIEYKHNLEEKIRLLWMLRVSTIKEARRSALSSMGFFITKEIQQFIIKQGEGTWKKPHPMTRLWKREKNGSWSHRHLYLGVYSGLAKFARYLINTQATQLQTGFGTFSGQQVLNGEKVRFNPFLQKIAQNAQKNRTLQISSKMRRMLGAQRRKKEDVPGQDIFPVKKETLTLKIAARPIVIPVFRKIKERIGVLFADKFRIALQKRYDNYERRDKN